VDQPTDRPAQLALGQPPAPEAERADRRGVLLGARGRQLERAATTRRGHRRTRNWALHRGFGWPEPLPPPVTTIAWRLAHLIVGVFGMRAANHFDAPVVSYQDFPYAGTATQALAQLDQTYASWRQGVGGLSATALARPCGPAEGLFAEYPMAALVLHINREAIHHGAEILVLRDLYRHRATISL
jgi:hypothetical protein